MRTFLRAFSSIVPTHGGFHPFRCAPCHNGWASEVFCQRLFEGRTAEHLLGQQLLQLAILVLERL